MLSSTRIELLQASMEKLGSSYCSLESCYNSLLKIIETQNKLMHQGTAMDLAVLLVHMANDEEEKALEVLRNKHFMEAYLKGAMKYKAEKYASNLLESISIKQSIVEGGCEETLATILAFYRQLEHKEDFSNYFRSNLPASLGLDLRQDFPSPSQDTIHPED